MNARQQITNRHITDAAAMTHAAWPLIPDDLWEPYRLLTNFLSAEEIRELRRQLDGSNVTHKRIALLHWYNLVEAREHLLKVDAQVRRDRRRLRPSYAEAERVAAVAAAKALGMIVEQDSWTMDVQAVRIV